MTPIQGIWLAAVLFGVGLWLMLPRGKGRGRRLGMCVIAGAGAVLAAQLFAVGGRTENVLFVSLAVVTVVAGIGTVTMRSPVYCALWFAMALLGTAGLFLLQGAQFLGLATVVVYAGAIVVTFLFVLMLAQPEGHTFYDRLSWQAPISALAGALIVGILSTAICSLFFGQSDTVLVASPAAPEALQSGVLAEEHVAAVGSRLFSEHLISVQLAALLLMVALIGTTAIVTQRREFATRTLWREVAPDAETLPRGNWERPR